MGFGVPKLAQPQRRAPGAPAKGTDRPLIPTRAWEDEDASWGGREGGRDDEIKGDKPPHWG